MIFSRSWTGVCKCLRLFLTCNTAMFDNFYWQHLIAKFSKKVWKYLICRHITVRLILGLHYLKRQFCYLWSIYLFLFFWVRYPPRLDNLSKLHSWSVSVRSGKNSYNGSWGQVRFVINVGEVIVELWQICFLSILIPKLTLYSDVPIYLSFHNTFR